MAPALPLAAGNLDNARWAEPAGIASFGGGRCWGVVDAAGRMLSFNGDRPSVWDTKRIASTIADTLTDPDTLTWIDPIPTA